MPRVDEHALSLGELARAHDAIAAERDGAHPDAAARRADAGVEVGVDAYWCDASGLYLRGFAHAGAAPITAISLCSGERRATQEPTLRQDVADLYPGTHVPAACGFALYLPGRPLDHVTLELDTEHGPLLARVALPDGPLPVLPLPAVDLDAALDRFLAVAGSGPILTLGGRLHDDANPAVTRASFGARRVVNVDIHAGRNVDVVGDVHQLSRLLPPGSFAGAYSASLLEHVIAPWLVAAEINRMLVPGAPVLHVAPTVWPEHAMPNDFWRFTPEGLAVLFGAATGFEVIDKERSTGCAFTPTPRGEPSTSTCRPSPRATSAGSWPARWPRWTSMPSAGRTIRSRASAPPGNTQWTESAGCEEHQVPGQSVSVVVPLYNGRAYVRGALDSVIRQSMPPREVIVVDDGSSDGSAEVVAGIEAPFPIEVVRQANAGQSAARNAGVRRARGEFIAFLDQDDEWRSGHLEALVKAISKRADVGWAYSDFDELDARGRTVTHSFIREHGLVHPKRTLAECVAADVMALPSASLLRRSASSPSAASTRRCPATRTTSCFCACSAPAGGTRSSASR